MHNTSSHLTFESRQLAIQNAFQTWSDVSTLTFIGTKGEMGEFMII
ncbi:MAG: hypothetical protein IJ066_10975 [Bacteroidaceae bacterium]|nr:hypothetical protein [Bacteroidaceae bacterium]